MAQDQSTFDAYAYLRDNPDVAEAGFDPWTHYQDWGKSQGRQASFFNPQGSVADPSKWYLDRSASSGFSGDVYRDPNTGNLYKASYIYNPVTEQNEINPDISKNTLLASFGALSDKYSKYVDTPEEKQKLYELKATNPNEYYGKVAENLGDKVFTNWATNNSGSNTELLSTLEGLKDVAPDVYYKYKLQNLGQQAGWQIGQNRSDRNAATIAEIESLIPQAQKAGLSINEINSLINNSVNQANLLNQQRIASDAAMGGPGTFTGGIPVLAMAALAAATGGAGAAAAGTGAGTAAGLEGYMASAGLAPGLFEGAAFTMPNLAGYAGMADYMSQAGLDAGNFANTGLAGPTYGELGYTGLEAGQMGPTYQELGYTGLNNAEAIAAADAAQKGMTLSEALSYANKARQGLGLANTLSKVIGGTGRRSGGGTSGVDLNKLANMLSPNNAYKGLELAQIAPKNPFLFTTPGQTEAAPGTYDVSGMANALRKKNYGIG